MSIQRAMGLTHTKQSKSDLHGGQVEGRETKMVWACEEKV